MMMFRYIIFDVLAWINYQKLDDFLKHLQICKINTNNERLFDNNGEMYRNSHEL